MTLSTSCLRCANRHKAAGNRKRGGVKSQAPPNHFQHQKLLLVAGIPRQTQSFRSRSGLDVCPSPRTGPAPPRCARSAAGRWRHLLAPSGRSAQGCAPAGGSARAAPAPPRSHRFDSATRKRPGRSFRAFGREASAKGVSNTA